MTGSEAVAALERIWETALYYARQSMSGANTDPQHDSSTALWVRQLNELSFDSPYLGYQMGNSNASFATWATKFEGAVTDLMGYRETFGFDGHAVQKTDSGFDLNPDGIYYNGLTDDPLQAWWLSTAKPLLIKVGLDQTIDWATYPLRAAAGAVDDALSGAGPYIAILIVVLVLILAIRLT